MQFRRVMLVVVVVVCPRSRGLLIPWLKVRVLRGSLGLEAGSWRLDVGGGTVAPQGSPCPPEIQSAALHEQRS